MSGSGVPSRILLYSDQPVVAAGVWEVFREGPLAPAVVEIATDPGAVTRAGGLLAALIDLGAPGAEQAVRLARSQAQALLLLVPNLHHALDVGLSSDADAILLRDELGPDQVALALAAERFGTRLVARGLGVIARQDLEAAGIGSVTAPTGGRSAPAAGVPDGASSDTGHRALALLADGLRDAEIARLLNLSESATRKLIQRTVQRLGARTRAQAVAEAVRGGRIA